jgi:hypothetical protein
LATQNLEVALQDTVVRQKAYPQIGETGRPISRKNESAAEADDMSDLRTERERMTQKRRPQAALFRLENENRAPYFL